MEQSASTDAPEIAPASSGSNEKQTSTKSKWIGWSSLFFAVVQSVCSAFVALSSVRLLIGAAAFSSALGLLKVADKIHFNAIRVPMLLVALAGSLVNLVAVWQVRRLRGRSASAWRQSPLSSKKLNAERLQLTLSILTLVLLAFEYYFHIKLEQR